MEFNLSRRRHVAGMIADNPFYMISTCRWSLLKGN